MSTDNVPSPNQVAEARRRLRETNPDIATALDALDLSVAGIRSELAEMRETVRAMSQTSSVPAKTERVPPKPDPAPDAEPHHEG